MDFLKRWISQDVLNDRVAKHQCCICGYSIPGGKGQDSAPLTTMKGAFACNYCFQEVVMKAREAVDVIMNAATQISGEEARKQLQAKQGMND